MNKKLSLELKKVTIRQLAVRTRLQTGILNGDSADGGDGGSTVSLYTANCTASCSLNVKTAACGGGVR